MCGHMGHGLGGGGHRGGGLRWGAPCIQYGDSVREHLYVKRVSTVLRS